MANASDFAADLELSLEAIVVFEDVHHPDVQVALAQIGLQAIAGEHIATEPLHYERFSSVWQTCFNLLTNTTGTRTGTGQQG